MKFIDTSEIIGYDIILSKLYQESLFCYWFEHIGHLVSDVKYYNPDTRTNAEKLKKMCFQIIDAIVCTNKWYRPWYEASFVKTEMDAFPKTCDEMFEYLDKYWDINTEGDGGPERGYLIFFISYTSHKYNQFFPNG